ncbi:hypothetical protein GGR56DRAFT_648770 [Xylariaceae sp. FL0804]|nr:hypothetical protein GGR56DRAFT_648770 [Xylariaceae sp. FL0804]
MLPSSLRCVAASVPPCPLLPALSTAGSRAPAAFFAAACNPRAFQRRRYSSSKPSSGPNDSPKGYSAGQVTAPATQSTKRRRKVKDASGPQQTLPSVPSTEDVPQKALALSTFFSLHRPMSVTQCYPKTITDDAFARIFAPPTQSQKWADGMSVMSRTVEDLDMQMQDLRMSTQSPGEAAATAAAHGEEANGEIRRMHIKHDADGTATAVSFEMNQTSGHFLPFRPPPVPQSAPESSPIAEAGAVAEAQSEPESQHRVYKAIFTLEETIDGNGDAQIVAHSPKLVERNTLRQAQREQVRGQARDMFALSVVRRRKLRMKKKKYKKLLKRTRNERRKLDQV